MMAALNLTNLSNDYHNSSKRLIIFDYDSTLAPIAQMVELKSSNDSIRSLIGQLASDRRNHIVIMSGHDRQTLNALLTNVPAILVAEHGGYYRTPGGTWNEMFRRDLEAIPRLLPFLNALTFQFEGSFIEEKSFSVVWHFKDISQKVSDTDKKEILSAIHRLDLSSEFTIYDGDCSLEFRIAGISKRSFVRRWRSNRDYEFEMVVDNGSDNDDLFTLFNDQAYTVTIGASTAAHAKFNVPDHSQIPSLIAQLTGEPKKRI